MVGDLAAAVGIRIVVLVVVGILVVAAGVIGVLGAAVGIWIAVVVPAVIGILVVLREVAPVIYERNTQISLNMYIFISKETTKYFYYCFL